MKSTPSFHLFERFGIELEYMIVDKDTLNVKPITDLLFHDLTGEYTDEVDCKEISYSNELALHVFEMRNKKPTRSILDLPAPFQLHVNKVNQALLKHHAMLLPTGAHPWMNPANEMKLWPHGDDSIYQAYHKIFDCRGHGWSNLQSAHLNLPFCGDEEFAKLHAAIRFLLPLMPALSASTPVLEGQFSKTMDRRLETYRFNHKKIPAITGSVIPEIIHSQAEYQEKILQPMYKAIADFDPEAILQEEWLNSRGAIARFCRNTIEIRILDNQENPLVDCAIASAVVFVLKKIIAESWGSLAAIQQFPQEALVSLYNAGVEQAEEMEITDLNYLHLLGISSSMNGSNVWHHLLTPYFQLEESTQFHPALRWILTQGTLARRISKAYRANPTKVELKKIYLNLASCLEKGTLYSP
jgi:carboxylate-amine ligase